jgi:hypothetical protein
MRHEALHLEHSVPLHPQYPAQPLSLKVSQMYNSTGGAAETIPPAPEITGDDEM